MTISNDQRSGRGSDGEPDHGPARVEPHSLRVLVLDDDDATRLAIGQYLEQCGHVVALASSIDQALGEVHTINPQVVVCDWKLGEMRDGIEAARLLTNECQVQIVFVTAHSLVDLRRHFNGVEPAGCLRKPVSLVDLSAAVSAAARRAPAH